jgi:hypothetical protein
MPTSAEPNGHMPGAALAGLAHVSAPQKDGVSDAPDEGYGMPTLRRLGSFVLVVVVLLGLVSLGSRPGDSTSIELAGSGIGVLVLQVVASAAILAGLAIVGLMVPRWPGRRRKRKPEDEYVHYVEPVRVHWAVKLVLLVLPLAVLGVVIADVVFFGGGSTSTPPTELASAPPGSTPALAPGQAPSGPSQNLPSFAWVSGGVVLLVAFASIVWVLRQRVYAARAESPERGFARVIDDGLSALERETDPRRAVILAYCAMERALARQGLARREPEAPVEYMFRVLTDVPDCTEPVYRLTELFEEAKFSHHAIAQGSRTSAVEALLSVREALQAAAWISRRMCAKR